jgi:hypothetical protein
VALIGRRAKAGTGEIQRLENVMLGRAVESPERALFLVEGYRSPDRSSGRLLGYAALQGDGKE